VDLKCNVVHMQMQSGTYTDVEVVHSSPDRAGTEIASTVESSILSAVGGDVLALEELDEDEQNVAISPSRSSRAPSANFNRSSTTMPSTPRTMMASMPTNLDERFSRPNSARNLNSPPNHAKIGALGALGGTKIGSDVRVSDVNEFELVITSPLPPPARFAPGVSMVDGKLSNFQPTAPVSMVEGKLSDFQPTAPKKSNEDSAIKDTAIERARRANRKNRQTGEEATKPPRAEPQEPDESIDAWQQSGAADDPAEVPPPAAPGASEAEPEDRRQRRERRRKPVSSLPVSSQPDSPLPPPPAPVAPDDEESQEVEPPMQKEEKGELGEEGEEEGKEEEEGHGPKAGRGPKNSYRTIEASCPFCSAQSHSPVDPNGRINYVTCGQCTRLYGVVTPPEVLAREQLERRAASGGRQLSWAACPFCKTECAVPSDGSKRIEHLSCGSCTRMFGVRVPDEMLRPDLMARPMSARIGRMFGLAPVEAA